MTIQTHLLVEEAGAVAAAQKATKAGLAATVEHPVRLELSPIAVAPCKYDTCGDRFIPYGKELHRSGPKHRPVHGG